jgi:hypothetical protein
VRADTEKKRAGQLAGEEHEPSNTRSRRRRWVPGRRCTHWREDEAGTIGVTHMQEREGMCFGADDDLGGTRAGVDHDLAGTRGCG